MTMKIGFIAIAAAAVIASSPVAFAQNQAKSTAPGQQMLQKGPAPGSPGASGYAPGHLKKKHLVRKSTHRHLARTSAHRQPAGMVQQKPMAKSGTTKSETTGMAPATTTTKQKKTDQQ
jgi:hypothetical protein